MQYHIYAVPYLCSAVFMLYRIYAVLYGTRVIRLGETSCRLGSCQYRWTTIIKRNTRRRHDPDPPPLPLPLPACLPGHTLDPSGLARIRSLGSLGGLALIRPGPYQAWPASASGLARIRPTEGWLVPGLLPGVSALTNGRVLHTGGLGSRVHRL